MFNRILTLALVLSTSAVAQNHNRTDIVRGLCQPHGCDEFAILAADRVTTSGEGTLFKTRLKTFHASFGGRKDLAEENGHVFCSPTKPAIMAEQDGRTLAFFLAPFATAESREVIRKNANYHALYFTICHGMEAGKGAVHNLSGVAQGLGYRVALAQSKLVPLKRAEDIIALGEHRPAEARHDDRPPPSREVASVEARWEERSSEVGAPRPRHNAPAPAKTDEGLLATPRRLTNRAFDALDKVGDWVLGR